MASQENTTGTPSYQYGDSISKTVLANKAPIRILVKLVFTLVGVFEGIVEVFGSWNGWSEGKKLEERDGKLTVAIDVRPGRYEFKYRKADGEWFHDNDQDMIPNAFGTYNNVVDVTCKNSNSGPADAAVGPEDAAVGPEDAAVGPEDAAVGPEDAVAGPEDATAGPAAPAVPAVDSAAEVPEDNAAPAVPASCAEVPEDNAAPAVPASAAEVPEDKAAPAVPTSAAEVPEDNAAPVVPASAAEVPEDNAAPAVPASGAEVPEDNAASEPKSQDKEVTHKASRFQALKFWKRKSSTAQQKAKKSGCTSRKWSIVRGLRKILRWRR
uniref:5'-AMP-activated protein kinase subunit beta-1 n=1 Tax=Branchiostoma floridae TaxID=7739 RepID=C3YGD6_BRAFL|eukprot:XP_002604646.1 hypothetical protein BRAFLDRAFT_92880 [Branchiostoma floridae]